MSKLRELVISALIYKWQRHPTVHSNLLCKYASKVGLDPLEIIRSVEFNKNPNHYREEK